MREQIRQLFVLSKPVGAKPWEQDVQRLREAVTANEEQRFDVVERLRKVEQTLDRVRRDTKTGFERIDLENNESYEALDGRITTVESRLFGFEMENTNVTREEMDVVYQRIMALEELFKRANAGSTITEHGQQWPSIKESMEMKRPMHGKERTIPVANPQVLPEDNDYLFAVKPEGSVSSATRVIAETGVTRSGDTEGNETTTETVKTGVFSSVLHQMVT